MESVLSITPLKTAPHSPWQNGYAERFVGTIRRELTDHVIPLSENHLRSLVIEYMRHYNEDRTHSSLGKDSPHGRLRAEMPPDRPLISVPRFRGLHTFRWRKPHEMHFCRRQPLASANKKPLRLKNGPWPPPNARLLGGHIGKLVVIRKGKAKNSHHSSPFLISSGSALSPFISS